MIRGMKKGALAVLAAMFALPLGACSDDGVGTSVVPNVEAIVFVERAFEDPATGNHNVMDGNMQTIDYLRYVPGGGLMMLSPPRRTAS